jgi:hypothetical protein
MARGDRRALARLFLLLAVLLALTSGQRLLRPADHQLMATEVELRALKAQEALAASAASSSSASADVGSATGNATAGTSTAASQATETKEEGPSVESFTGPLIAGAVAIVLIGAVVAFKHRRSAQ